MPVTLPSVDDVHAFMEVLNRGREAIGLSRLDGVNYDACTPMTGEACLSARHLFAHANMNVGFDVVHLDFNADDAAVAAKLAVALNLDACDEYADGEHWYVPPEIKRVTDAFDCELVGLRQLFDEAGVLEDVPESELAGNPPLR